MLNVDDASSDEDLYAWFVDAMAREFGFAEEVEPNVIHVREPLTASESDEDTRPYELRITRQQLRSVAHSDVNIFDDTQGPVSVPTSNPVHAGLDAFTFYTQELMDCGSGLSRTLVFRDGRMTRLHLGHGNSG